jgi:putative ABC transport system ATP-binding protein
MDLLQRLNHDHGQTFVLVTHDAGIAQRTQRIIRMQDGEVIADEPVTTSVAAAAPVQAPAE